MGFQDTFKRKEKKFLLTRAQYDELMGMLEEYLIPDEYYHSDIHSIYYDTDSYDIIDRSLDKPLYKEKLRVRDYGTEQIFVELKKKFKGIVYKRRVLVPRSVAVAWLDESVPFEKAMRAAGVNRELTFMEKQVSAEVNAFIARYDGKLTRSMDIHADRYSFREKDADEPIRLTFDTGIWYDDLRGESAGREERLTEFVVMETKVAEAYPLWLAKALSQMQLFPTSFSKYGTAYKRLMKTSKRTKEAKSIKLREAAVLEFPEQVSEPSRKLHIRIRNRKVSGTRRLVNA